MNARPPTSKTIFLAALEIERPRGARRLPRRGLRRRRRPARPGRAACSTAHDRAGELPRVARRRRRPSTDRRRPGRRGPRHGHRPLQAAGADRRRRHGRRLHGRADSSPVRRRVALKVIKPGMDTRQVIARFEAERQALALMDHPNIAKVLDAGTTDTGRPYFVMELVQGVPITEYCDQRPALDPASGWSCSSRSARPCSTPIRRGSSTATSSRRTSWSRCTTAGRCPR